VPDGRSCPACRLAVDIPDGSEDCVLSCPECGQCLRVPPSWPPAAPADVSLVGSCVPAPGKMPGRYGVVMGALFAVPIWLIPGVGDYARLALTMLGAAIFVEGMGRLRAEARKRLPRQPADVLAFPERMAEGVDLLGNLRAVFRTGPDRRTDALAIALFGLAFACGEGYILELLRDGAKSLKLHVAAFAAPCLAAYLLYRAARCFAERRCVLIFTGGLVSLHNRRTDVHLRETIADVKQVEIGDAIDERAVEIKLKGGKPPLRFTCVHFPNLDRFADHVRLAFSPPTIPPAGGAELAACGPAGNAPSAGE
jgi:hypothetical protein